MKKKVSAIVYLITGFVCMLQFFTLKMLGIASVANGRTFMDNLSGIILISSVVFFVLGIINCLAWINAQTRK